MAVQNYDVLIIGSGASGGMAAYTLTKKGASCLMLDAGPLVDFNRARTQKPVYDLPYRGFGEPGKLPHVLQANEFNANQWVDEKQVPYTYDPGNPYNWVRVRMIGGKSLFWARMSFRLSDYEFKAKDYDGFGENWPISYADLKPFYDRVEPIFRVAGRNEGYEQLPDGVFLEDKSAWSGAMQRFIDSAKQRNIPVTKMRRATGSGQFASSYNLLLPDAVDTGKLTIVPNAVVRDITLDKNSGLVNGANFLDRHSGREMHARGGVVIVAASCLESTRILLNSNLANSSGVLGHYLHDQFYISQGVQAIVPEALDGKAPRGLMGGGGYTPRFVNLKGGKQEDFIRGYAYDFSAGGTPDPKYIPAYGAELEKKLNSYRGAGVSVTIMGEVLPRKENYVSIDKNVTDAWGIPVLHFQTRYTDNEFKMARHAMNTFADVCRGAGFEVLTKHDQMFPPGYSIHELGTCRMGDDPKKSVLNKWNQSHDIKNLFVVDGSSFVTGGYQNPTMTILALSMRASEYIAEQKKQGNL
ncbi:MAG: GMC family oxidoreductase [Acidobacteriaceae bacterium]|nr:GMC family oxidoreductase [Acidobacteriaceae bacterium]